MTFVMRVPARGQRARFLGLWPMRPAKRVIWLMVAGWLVPPLLVGLGILLSAALGFVQLDLTFAAFAAELEKAVPAGTPLPPVQVIVFAQLAMIPVGGLFNSLFAFGEELGWRGWLLPALRPLGTWPALILSGVIWGAWHSPVILLGYNFGRTDLTGVLLMIGGCVAWGILLGWLRLRSASVWPAVIAHGSLNAAAGLVLIVAATQPDMALAGPLGVATWIVLAPPHGRAGADRAVPRSARARRCSGAPALRTAVLTDGSGGGWLRPWNPPPPSWSEADAFLSDLLVGPDAYLESALSAQREAGLPEIEVAPVAGKLLNLLVRISGARRVLEVGTTRRLFHDLARAGRRPRRASS